MNISAIGASKTKTLKECKYGVKNIERDMKKNWKLYLMASSVFLYYILFHYKPMYGAIIAFKDFSPGLGILGSPWVGLENFRDFFEGQYFVRTLLNTLNISISSIIFGFPAPIILALLINEVNNKYFAKVVQTVSYMPHFISLVVVCGLVKVFVSDTGIINYIFSFFGGTPTNLLQSSKAFVPIYVISTIWQQIGWDSIIYLCAITGVNQDLYEAAEVDGAGKLRQTWSVTLPGIMPTIVTMLILKLGQVMNVGFEKIILLYNPMTYETADVISSYVYRVGLQDFKYGYSAAVGLFNSVINFMLIILANSISKKLNDTSLW